MPAPVRQSKSLRPHHPVGVGIALPLQCDLVHLVAPDELQHAEPVAVLGTELCAVLLHRTDSLLGSLKLDEGL